MVYASAVWPWLGGMRACMNIALALRQVGLLPPVIRLSLDEANPPAVVRAAMSEFVDALVRISMPTLKVGSLV